MSYRACLAGVLGALVLGLVSSITVVPAARAQTNAEARAFFEQGNRHYAQALRRRGRRRAALLQQALEAYVQSLGIVRTQNVVYNAAIVLEELQRYDEAFAYLTEYLRFEGLSEQDRATATDKRESLRARVAVVSVTSVPAGAEVRIGRRDLAPAGSTPLEVAVPAGEHPVFVSLRGYDDAELTAAAQVGQRVDLNATLEAQPVPVTIRAPATGTLTIDGEVVRPNSEIQVIPGRHVIRFEPATVREIVVEPGVPLTIDLNIPAAGAVGMLAVVTGHANATVSVDGTVMGEGERVEVELNAGTRSVRVDVPGYAPAQSEVDVPAGGTIEANVTLQTREEGSTLGPLPAIAWAITGAATVVTAVLGGRAISKKNEFDDAPSQTLLDETQDANRNADIALGVAVGLGLTALLLTILNDDVEQDPSTINVTAAPLPGGGGMVGASLPVALP